MHKNIWYEITNNATFASVLAIIFAAYFAIKGYSNQKNIDRDADIKKEIINTLILLQEKCHYVLLIIDRIANTYIHTDRKKADFFENDIKSELPELSLKVNDEIPSLNTKIKSKIDIYFENEIVVQNQLEVFRIELKKWHEFVVHIKFDLTSRVNDQSNLSLEKFDFELKKLIKFIWDHQSNQQNNLQ